MLTLLGSALGFGTSIIPEVLGYFKQKQANQQELAMLEAKAKYAEKLSELKVKELDAQADIVESQSIYQHDNNLDSGSFVNALRGSVRPIITYAFFVLFAAVKGTALVAMMNNEGVDLATGLLAVWDSETQAIFSAIIAFWFGNRAMSKARARIGK